MVIWYALITKTKNYQCMLKLRDKNIIRIVVVPLINYKEKNSNFTVEKPKTPPELNKVKITIIRHINIIIYLLMMP